MKVICIESASLRENESVQTAVKGSVYTVVNAVKDPRPIVKANGEYKEFAKGFWYQFAETGSLWHHESRFEKFENKENIYTINLEKPKRFSLYKPTEDALQKPSKRAKKAGSGSKSKTII
jgi:hypothetical protein